MIFPPFCWAEILPISKFKAFITAKMAVFGLPEPSKLISRKVWMAEKSLIFHTVPNLRLFFNRLKGKTVVAKNQPLKMHPTPTLRAPQKIQSLLSVTMKKKWKQTIRNLNVPIAEFYAT